jgi:signal transduction histidine kinase
VKNFTDEHGLPQNTVKSITADNLGFVWLCTESGLARFDGRNVVDFTTVEKSPGLTRYFDIVPDMNGNNDRFFAARLNHKTVRIQNGLALYDSVFTYDRLLKKLLLKNDKETLITFGAPGLAIEDSPEFLVRLFVPVTRRKGCYFKITRQKISFYDNWKHQWTRKNPYELSNRFFVHGITLYHFNTSGTIHRFEALGRSQVALFEDLELVRSKGAKSKLFWNVVNDQLFLLIGDRFYYLHANEKDEWKTDLLIEGFSFEANHIRSAYYEFKSGHLLLGSKTKGFYVIRKNNFYTIRNGEDDIKNVFYAQISLDSNRILLPDGNIKEIVKEGEHFIRLSKSETSQIKKGSTADLRYMIRDRKGYIWSSNGGNLQRYSADGERLLHQFTFTSGISCLFETPRGDIIAGVKSNGFYKIFTDGRNPTPYIRGWDSADGTYVIPADSTNLWLGTDKGLFIFDTSTNKRKLVTGTESFYIRSIHPSRQTPGTVFFTTFSEGLFYYNGKRIIKFPLDARNYLTSSHCIVEDNGGYFWITTNKGLFQIYIEDLYRYAAEIEQKDSSASLFYLYYNKYDGFYSNEFNGGCQPCALRLENGFVSLPSINGLVLFDPERIQPNLPDRQLIIDRIEEGDRIRVIANDTVRLAMNPRNVNFFISTPYFGNTENLHFSYAMMPSDRKPVDEDWITSRDMQLSINFSELGSGHHKLWVRKWNGFGTNKFVMNTVDVFVPLNWYETLWFKMLIGSTLIALVLLVTTVRTRNLRRRNQQLEDKVAERTQSLQQALYSLQTSEKELSRQMQLQSRLVASISHDVRSPINYLATAADLAGAMEDRNNSSEARKLMADVGASARQIFNMVDNMVNFSKSQIYGMHTKGRPVLLRALIDDKIRIFRSMLIQRSIVFSNGIPETLEVSSSQQLLGIMVHNLLDNALKHAQRGSTVKVFADSRPDGWHLIFSDSGNGLPEEILQWLNSVDSKDDSLDSSPQNYSGLGLLIVIETAAVLGIRLLAENRDGAFVHLIFPSTKTEKYNLFKRQI